MEHEIEQSERSEENQIELKSSLVIDCAQEHDSGKYTVRAINRSGVKSSSVNLMIKGDYIFVIDGIILF